MKTKAQNMFKLSQKAVQGEVATQSHSPQFFFRQIRFQFVTQMKVRGEASVMYLWPPRPWPRPCLLVSPSVVSSQPCAPTSQGRALSCLPLQRTAPMSCPRDPRRVPLSFSQRTESEPSALVLRRRHKNSTPMGSNTLSRSAGAKKNSTISREN